jgi:hypothetical protein
VGLTLTDVWMILITIAVFALMDLAAGWFGSW